MKTNTVQYAGKLNKPFKFIVGNKYYEARMEMANVIPMLRYCTVHRVNY